MGLSPAVLGLTALAQVAIFAASGSVALLADLIHNFGDAATAIPLGIAFALRSERAERGAGLFVVLAIFASACVAGYESVSRLIDPQAPTDLLALAAVVAVGLPIADPLIGLAITAVIVKITWDSWWTVRGHGHAC